MKFHCVFSVPVVMWSCIVCFQCRWWYEVALCVFNAGGNMKLRCVFSVPVVMWSCVVWFQCRWWCEVALCVFSAGGDMKLRCVIPVPVVIWSCVVWFQCRWWYEVALYDSSAGGAGGMRHDGDQRVPRYLPVGCPVHCTERKHGRTLRVTVNSLSYTQSAD